MRAGRMMRRDALGGWCTAALPHAGLLQGPGAAVAGPAVLGLLQGWWGVAHEARNVSCGLPSSVKYISGPGVDGRSTLCSILKEPGRTDRPVCGDLCSVMLDASRLLFLARVWLSGTFWLGSYHCL